MSWIEKLKKLQSGEYKVTRFRPIVENITLPEVEVKADNSSSSNLKKYALGAAIVAALGYFVWKW